MTRDIRSQIALGLADHLGRILPPSRSEWAAGMKAEIEAIEEPGAALAFAWGCLGASCLRRLRTLEGALFAVRIAAAATIMMFAIQVLATAHAFMGLTTPDLLPPVTAGIGLAFAAAGLALLGRGPIALAAVAAIMLVLNTIGLVANGMTVTVHAVVLRALVLEGYLLWSLLLLAGLMLHGCGRSVRLARFAQRHGWAG
ncbi:MAG: hypothetical protein Q8S03_10905 [Brevundimonas sp.]|uniref:hypothetical protein n=1 Tax=Brevundimonas sp. TaxID=1871086 RepID=UPI0027356104|nr:hypothetical protein [Brevundimonas sp.]MDP3405191.1 hypothetical protein [Brevundimonas sp.]